MSDIIVNVNIIKNIVATAVDGAEARQLGTGRVRDRLLFSRTRADLTGG